MPLNCLEHPHSGRRKLAGILDLRSGQVGFDSKNNNSKNGDNNGGNDNKMTIRRTIIMVIMTINQHK